MAVQEQELRIRFTGENGSFEEVINRNIRANDKLLASEGKVKKHLSGLVADLSSATNAGDATAMAIGRLSEVMKVGFGAAVGVGVGMSIKSVIESTAAELEKLENVAQEVFSMDARQGEKSFQQLANEASKARAAADAYNESLMKLDTRFGRIKQNLMGAFGISDSLAGTEINRREAIREEMLAREREAVGGMVILEDRRRGIIEMQASGYEEQAKTLERQIKNALELYNIEQAGGALLREAAERRQQAEERLIDRQRSIRAMSRESEMAAFLIRREGENVDVQLAEDKLRMRRAELAMENSPERRAMLEFQMQVSEEEVSNARKKRFEENQTLRIKEAEARMMGDADERKLRVLTMEREEIARRLRAATPDEKVKLTAEFAGIGSAITDQEQLLKEAQVRREMLAIEATRRHGKADELRIMREIGIKTEELLNLEMQSDRASKDKIAGLATELAGNRRNAELKEAELQVELASLRAQRDILSIEGSTASEAEKRYKITQAQLAAVRAEIAAMASLNGELANAARLREQGLRNQLQAQDENLNFGKSERDIRQRLREERIRQRQLERFRERRAANDGLIDVKRDIAGNVIEGTNPVTGEREKRTPESNLSPDKFKPRLREQMEEDTKQFRERFRKRGEAGPHSTEEDRKKAMEAGAGDVGRESLNELKAINAKLDAIEDTIAQ